MDKIERTENFGKVIFYPKTCLLVELGDSEKYSKQTSLSAPNTVHLLITYRCNLNCLYCDQRYLNIEQGGELTTMEWKQVIDQLADSKVFQIAMGGGEPFMRADLFELIDYASKKGLVVNLTTNGLFLNKYVNQLQNAKIYQIQVSLDGHTPKIHNLTHQSDFNKVINNIKEFKGKMEHIKIGINHIIHRGNLNFLDKFIKFCKRLQVEDVRLLSPKPPLAPLSKKEITWVKKIIEKNSGNIRIGLDDCLAVAMGFGRGCMAGRKMCIIAPNGEVKGCSHINLSYGNILQTSLQEIWQTQFSHFRRVTFGEVNNKCLLRKT